ncbi:ABC transporter family protein [Roseimicrobium gellanilyticum]|uniref:ABC transporter family protein n=1 Tax=Roseimicrobium gellanilyticum TaxID=748857 RepID=A0A366H4R7_9BACT|nr:ATP-binding cassette domain-containing protein [Roseimicrobium gellanilyticum]RBP36385.1 ABC transporter family protein [Roseimicrobium gellanilyticum]
MASDPAPSIDIEPGTRFGYQSGPIWKKKSKVLVEAGEKVRVGPGLHLFVAPNGAGKTTLIRSLAGLLQPISGCLSVNGTVHYFADELRMDPELKPKALFRSVLGSEAREHAMKLADTLKLSVTTPISKLSRGNRQKTILILAESQLQQVKRSVLLMDEPLSGLDAETREQVVDLWAKSSTQVVRLVIMHELESVHHADSLFTIHSGALRHTSTKSGSSWMDTYHSLQK